MTSLQREATVGVVNLEQDNSDLSAHESEKKPTQKQLYIVKTFFFLPTLNKWKSKKYLAIDLIEEYQMLVEFIVVKIYV